MLKALSYSCLLGLFSLSNVAFADTDADRQAQIAQARARAEQNTKAIEQKQQAQQAELDKARAQREAAKKGGGSNQTVTLPNAVQSSPAKVPPRENFVPQQTPTNDNDNVTGFANQKTPPASGQKRSNDWNYGF